MKSSQCSHRRIKRNYPFGRKSKADKFCKDCGMVLTNKLLMSSKKPKSHNTTKKEVNKNGKRN